MQRFFDVVLSGMALIVLSPLLLAVVVALRLTGEGEILFLQGRIGKDGKVFKLYKFATMLKNSPNMGTQTVTIQGDPRVLPVGKFLRKTKINELPQLLNILLGDMSVVGPRPLTRQTFGCYSSSTQELVKQVRPGLSGVGSIIFRGEEELLAGEAGSVAFYGKVIAPYKGAVEEWYVAHQSLPTYAMVIFATVWVVLFPDSPLAWHVFSGLPEPPVELKKALKYR